MLPFDGISRRKYLFKAFMVRKKGNFGMCL